MAAYGALVSVMHIIEQLQHHPCPPITLDKQQAESLTKKIAFLQEFLEVYNSHYSNQEMERLRNRIADAAYAAEDVIESHIVDETDRENVSLRYLFEEADGLQSPTADAAYAIDLYQGLQKVIETMDSIKKDVMEIKEKMGNQEQLQRITTTPVSSKSPSTDHNTMVGFDDVLLEMLDKLTKQPSYRQIIPIVGMGGIGKTTLAKSIYINPLIEYRFDIRAWTTISQEYNMQEVLLGVLLSEKNQENRESLSQMSEAELGEKLYKSLFGRRYLIVMDDVWSNDIWDRVKSYFPDNNNGSRIIITTRLSSVASYFTSSCGFEMGFLDQDNSWSLFCKSVFGKENCPHELEEIGKKIAQNCKGLPLSIVVLGGVLAKSKQTQEYWEYIVENLNSIVNLEENERCLKILHTSYDHLPVHLKTCFLYMGSYLEDRKIYVPQLLSTWVAEGFLKPVSGKSLEESAEDYLMDLIDRNLILVGEGEYSGKINYCNIHDLLRDLCIREAQKEKFTQRRIVIHQKTSKNEYLHTLKSASVARSLICYSEQNLPLVEFRLLRVFKDTYSYGKEKRRDRKVMPSFQDIFQMDSYGKGGKSMDSYGKGGKRKDSYGKGKRMDKGERTLEAIFQKVNLRYLIVNYPYRNLIFPSVSLLWNLHTLIIHHIFCGISTPLEIWKMPLLRHVESNSLRLSDPPSGHTDRRDNFVLHNLHTLWGIIDLKFGEEVIKRIPNVKKLRLSYDCEVASDYCLNNLGDLYKLESLDCSFGFDLLSNLIFPHSLKELSLCQTRFNWEDINAEIGSLPHLQMLKMQSIYFAGSEWETTEGQFCSLKYLFIYNCEHWEHWTAENTHFPRLEHLVLQSLPKLKEIPCGIGEIPTLQSIQLKNCSYSAIMSAKEILEEQESNGNEGIRVTVEVRKKKQGEFRVESKDELGREDCEQLESLAIRNFHVKLL